MKMGKDALEYVVNRSTLALSVCPSANDADVVTEDLDAAVELEYISDGNDEKFEADCLCPCDVSGTPKC